MRKLLLSFITLISCLPVKADEGMWIPMLIGKNIEEMQQMGFRLSAEDIYSINQASLKDAIVHFGGGCTGEMISGQGLLITNHHCGYGNIANLSTVENNYLEDGFWAKELSEELPAKGLTVRFLVRMEDVTSEIKETFRKGNERKREKAYEKAMKQLTEKAEEGGKYDARVASYFDGNQYFLLVYQTFTDVRLVGTPPKSLGKFGGDTDNWMWPRHTADFSIFRVYANADNEPASYSKENVPYKPKHFLPISLKGVQENDFAMVMGYPGRTNRYETSYGVEMAINISNPSLVKLRDKRLDIMRKAMRSDEAVNLKLASSFASIANYWKYFIGQTEQLKRLNVVEEKQKEEAEFIKWTQADNRPGFSNLMRDFAQAYSGYRPYAKHVMYYYEGFLAPGVVKIAAMSHELYKLLEDKKAKSDAVKSAVSRLKAARSRVLEDYVRAVDQDVLAATSQLFYEDIPKAQHPDVYQKIIFRDFTKDTLAETFRHFADHLFAHTLFLDDQRFETFCANPTIEALKADPAAVYAYSFIENFETNYLPKRVAFQKKETELSKRYIAGLMQMHPDRNYYPDANSTMRLTYGTVKGYSPKDAVYYDYYTTLDGLLAKYVPGDYEFDLDKDFLALAKEADFGRYANEDGELVTCFISNTDITGGNSGSPVINANGELLGLAFDGNWEAMSGDIAFDKNYKQNIAVDIRFVLWLVEKYGKAQNLIDEMTLVQ